MSNTFYFLFWKKNEITREIINTHVSIQITNYIVADE